jgi:hypothetical protein
MANEEIYEGEVIEVENQDMIPAEVDDAEDAGISTGAAMLIGAVITAGAIWVGGKVKKLIATHKAKKAAAEAAEEEEFEEVEPEAEPVEETDEA